MHVVRVGALGHVGRFRAADAVRYPRGQRVIARTARGLELGEVLCPSDGPGDGATEADGVILRPATVEDELVVARLLKHRDEALAACESKLAAAGVVATLLDVEQLFDGSSIYFYFLGDPPAEVSQLVDALAAEYEANVRFEAFAELVETGCGPGCGTESATGAGCGSCDTGCAVASACSTRRS